MKEEPVKKTSMDDLVPLLKEVYLDQLDAQLSREILMFRRLPQSKPYVPTFKDKWKKFWKHIPDFIDYVKEYRYDDWRYWDRDGF